MNKYLEKIAQLDKEASRADLVARAKKLFTKKAPRTASQPSQLEKIDANAAKRVEGNRRTASNARTEAAVAKQRDTVARAKANRQRVIEERAPKKPAPGRGSNSSIPSRSSTGPTGPRAASSPGELAGDAAHAADKAELASIRSARESAAARANWTRNENRATAQGLREAGRVPKSTETLTAREKVQNNLKPSERLLTTDALKNKFGGLHNRPAPAAAPAPQGKATFDTSGKSVQRVTEVHGSSGATPKVNIGGARAAAQAKPGLWQRMKNKFSSPAATPKPAAAPAPAPASGATLTTPASKAQMAEVKKNRASVINPKKATPRTVKPEGKAFSEAQASDRALGLPEPGTAAAARQARQAATPKPTSEQLAANREANTARVVEKKKGFFSRKPSYEVKMPEGVAASKNVAEKKGLSEAHKDAIKIGGGVVGGAVLMSALSKKPQEQTPQTPYY